MALAERVAQTPSTRTGLPCSIASLYEKLADQPAEVEALNLMLYGTEGRGWSAADVYEALRAEGHTVALQTINRHRGGKCRCPR